MKVLKFILGIIGLLILALIVVGLVGPEMKIETSTHIDKPAENVYSVFMDESRMPEWMSSFQSMEVVSGSKNEIGTKYKLIFEENGEKMEMFEIVTAIEKDKRYAFDFSNDVMDGTVDIRLLDADGGTDLNTTTTYIGKGFMFKALLPLFKGSMKKHMNSDYDKLRDIIEAS